MKIIYVCNIHIHIYKMLILVKQINKCYKYDSEVGDKRTLALYSRVLQYDCYKIKITIGKSRAYFLNQRQK